MNEQLKIINFAINCATKHQTMNKHTNKCQVYKLSDQTPDTKHNDCTHPSYNI